MILLSADLRDDEQFFRDHPSAVPITTAQVYATPSHVQDSSSLELVRSVGF